MLSLRLSRRLLLQKLVLLRRRREMQRELRERLRKQLRLLDLSRRELIWLPTL